MAFYGKVRRCLESARGRRSSSIRTDYWCGRRCIRWIRRRMWRSCWGRSGRSGLSRGTKVSLLFAIQLCDLSGSYKQCLSRPAQNSPSHGGSNQNGREPLKDSWEIEEKRSHRRSIVANPVESLSGCELELIKPTPVILFPCCIE